MCLLSEMFETKNILDFRFGGILGIIVYAVQKLLNFLNLICSLVESLPEKLGS